jgi:TonB family protein
MGLAVSYKIVVKNPDDPTTSKAITYYKSGKIKSEEEKFNPVGRKNGTIKHWYENGQLKSEIHYEDGSLDGDVITYWENSVLKREDFFEKGRLVNGTCYNVKGQEVPHYDYEVRPEYPGGVSQLLQFLATQVRYPAESRQRGSEGKVIVQFTVEKDGTVTNAVVKRGVDAYLDAEALRVVSQMARWQPGMIDGEAAQMLFTLPIVFSIQ